MLEIIRRPDPYALVPGELFEQLGWPLPDGGVTVKKLADEIAGGALDPRHLEQLDPQVVGYRAHWHVVRFTHYGLPWDITALKLVPLQPTDLPTVAFIHGGSANWYEFFLDPLNNPGLAQYLAQKVPVLLITIPGNYRPGGWQEEYGLRKPAYLLDQELDDADVALRNAVFTFALICDGVVRLIREVTDGPLLMAGHSTGGEIQFLVKEALADRMRDLSLGWATGGPALLRRRWEEDAGRAERRYPPLTSVRGRSPEGYINGYVGPLNPIGGAGDLDVARRWFALEERRRPQFKQPLQDMEHQGSLENRSDAERQIRAAAQQTPFDFQPDRVIEELFSTLETPLDGYRKMIWTVAAHDDGHWNVDSSKARELYVADQFRKANPDALIRVLVFDLPMTHYGHIERPRQLAGGILAAVRWLYE